MSVRIRSTCDKHAGRALGISDERIQQFEEVIQNILQKNERICYTRIGEIVSQQLDLNEKELFFVGMMIGGLAQFNMIVEGAIRASEMMNIDDSPVPVVKQMAYA